MVRQIYRVLWVLVLLTWASTGTAHASQGAETLRILLDDVEYWNPCNGEDVTMAGSLRLTFQEVDPNDRFVVIYSATLHAEGVGSQGNTYRLTFSDLLHLSVDGNDDASLSLGFDERFVLVTKGRGPNVRARLLNGHLVINANGDVVLNIFNDVQQSCLGSTR